MARRPLKSASTGLTADFDFTAHARSVGVHADVYWREYMAPKLRVCEHVHVVHQLKRRVCRVLKGIILPSEEVRLFKRFLEDPRSKAHCQAELRHRYGISREYISIRMITHLERLMAKQQPLPHPLHAYLAQLIPNRIPDDTLRWMVESEEFPNTLAGFTREVDILRRRQQALDNLRKAAEKAALAARPKRWAIPFAKYNEQKAQRARQLDRERIDYINAHTAQPEGLNLKGFERFCHAQITAMQPHASRRPLPLPAMVRLVQRLRSCLDPQCATLLLAQALHFANHPRTPEDIRTDTLAALGLPAPAEAPEPTPQPN